MKQNVMIVIAFLLLFSMQMSAQTFSAQGVLRDVMGNTVDDGNYNLTFKLYSDSTNGVELWSETQTGVDVLHGVFVSALGAVNSLESIGFDATYWLSISVNGSAESLPRIKFTNSPYTMSVIGADNIFPSSGNVGIGTLSPQTDLYVSRTDDAFITLNSSTGAETALYLASGGNSKWKLNRDAFDNSFRITDLSVGLVLTILPGGNVGIGTTSPETKLHVLGEGGANVDLTVEGQIRSNNNNGGLWISNDRLIGGHDTDKFGFYSGGDWRMTVDADGKVGIGTTTPAQALEVTGNVRLSNGALKFSDGTELSTAYLGTIAGSLTANDDLNIVADNDNNNSGEIKFKIDTTTVLKITNDGKVGIGTNSPASDLDVAGDIALTGSFTINNERYINDIWTKDANDNLYYTAGNVGIGRSNPQYALDVNGTMNVANLYINGQEYEQPTEWTEFEHGIYFDGFVNANYPSDFVGQPGLFTSTDAALGYVIFGSNTMYENTYVGYIGSLTYQIAEGAFTHIYTDNMAYYSSKQTGDPKQIKAPLEKILSLNGIIYDINVDEHPIYKDSKKRRELDQDFLKNNYGFIAQDLKEVIPEMVTHNLENDLYYITNYHQLFPVMTAAIRQFKKEGVDELERQIIDLEKKLDKLERK